MKNKIKGKRNCRHSERYLDEDRKDIWEWQRLYVQLYRIRVTEIFEKKNELRQWMILMKIAGESINISAALKYPGE